MGLLFLYIKALAFGIAVAAPVGPMSILCMRRTLVQGWKYGQATAIGIALSDSLYSAVAALGLRGISDFILLHKHTFNLLAAIFLICFGLKIFFTKAGNTVAHAENPTISLPYAFGSSFLMTMTNPLTLLFFVTAFTALTPESGYDHLSSSVTIAGVFSGSLLWASGIAASVSLFRHAISLRMQDLIDKITGIFLLLFALSEIWRYVAQA